MASKNSFYGLIKYTKPFLFIFSKQFFQFNGQIWQHDIVEKLQYQMTAFFKFNIKFTS